MTRIFIMRHGTTEMNLQRRMQGHIDTELNDEGRRQAAAAGEIFRCAGIVFDRVYSSPLSRARESARLVSGVPEKDILIDDRLIEFHYGVFEGKSYEQLDGVMADFLHDPEHVAPPEGVERIDDLNRRVASFLDENKTRFSESEHVLLMVHGIVIRSMYGYFNNTDPGEMWKIMVGNCEIFRVDLNDGSYCPIIRTREEGLL